MSKINAISFKIALRRRIRKNLLGYAGHPILERGLRAEDECDLHFVPAQKPFNPNRVIKES
jgi:hypothetical protein